MQHRWLKMLPLFLLSCCKSKYDSCVWSFDNYFRVFVALFLFFFFFIIIIFLGPCLNLVLKLKTIGEKKKR